MVSAEPIGETMSPRIEARQWATPAAPSPTVIIHQPVSLGQRLHTIFMLVKIGAVIWFCLFLYSVLPSFVTRSGWWAARQALGLAWPF